jgi:murein DD-endopeptidase MepM/ murein hydrolase activator NlpD
MGLLIERQGDTLCLNVEGTRLVFHPTPAGIWVNATAGDLKLEPYGNCLVLNTTVAKLIAYPLPNGDWILKGEFGPGPGPDPGEGDFSWPFEPTWLHWVTSEYGPRSGRFHEGIDMSGGPAVYGGPIPAIGDGTVHQSGLSGAFGYAVILNHGDFDGYTWYSRYAHMPSDAPRPPVGATVSKGDIIGQVNNTGSSFGSHLHMEIHRVPPGGSIRNDNLNPSYSSPRTAINPRDFFTVYGDGTWIIS